MRGDLEPSELAKKLSLHAAKAGGGVEKSCYFVACEVSACDSSETSVRRGGPVTLPSFLSWQGTIGRARYAIVGTLLFALKHNIDRVIATAYGYEWSIFNYWAFDRSLQGLTEL